MWNERARRDRYKTGNKLTASAVAQCRLFVPEKKKKKKRKNEYQATRWKLLVVLEMKLVHLMMESKSSPMVHCTRTTNRWAQYQKRGGWVNQRERERETLAARGGACDCRDRRLCFSTYTSAAAAAHSQLSCVIDWKRAREESSARPDLACLRQCTPL